MLVQSRIECQLVLVLTLLSALFACGGESSETTVEPAPAGARPNILVIVADDLGYTDLGAFGGDDIATPNLDRLARDGLRLTNFHTGPSCAPTRAMLLTGTDNHLAGMGSQGGLVTEAQAQSPAYANAILPAVPTIAERLQGLGYRTMASAKWHVGRDPETLPRARGFDSSFVLLEGGGGHFDDTPLFDFYGKASWLQDDEPAQLPADFYSSDHMADKLIEYIDQTPEHQPFFAYLGFTAPHWPLQAPAEAVERYLGRYEEGWHALAEERLQGAKREGVIPPHASGVDAEPGTGPWSELSAEEQTIEAKKMAVYAAMVEILDHNVGRIVEHLQQRGDFEDTVIVFLADNGAEAHRMEFYPAAKDWVAATFDNSLESIGSRNSYVSLGPSWARASAIPFRDSKSKVAEGGIRVPAFVHGIEHAGIDDSYMRVMDLAPTFVAMAGGAASDDMMGRSLLARWQGGPAAYPEDEIIAGETFGRRYAQQGTYKALYQDPPHGPGQWQLFDLARDVGEQQDLAGEQPERLAELVDAWQDYADSVGVILPDTVVAY